MEPVEVDVEPVEVDLDPVEVDLEPVQVAGETPHPTRPQPQGTNLPTEEELARLEALRAEALAEESLEV